MKKNKLKRISSRICGGGLLFLSNISLISIGFSSWSIGGAVSAEAEIKVSVDADVIDINSYINYENAEIFDFCRDGVVKDDVIIPGKDSSGNAVNNADILVTFKINLPSQNDKISNHINKGADSFNLETTFLNKCASFTNLFDQFLKSTSLYMDQSSGESNFNIYPYEKSNESLNYSTRFNISKGLDSSSISFKQKYTFSFPSGDDFYTQVFSKLNSGRFGFSFKAEVLL